MSEDEIEEEKGKEEIRNNENTSIEELTGLQIDQQEEEEWKIAMGKKGRRLMSPKIVIKEIPLEKYMVIRNSANGRPLIGEV